MSSDRERWRELGASNPYFAVCTDPRFRIGRMTETDREEFFALGDREVAETFAALHEFAPAFRPALSVDFGCGVGRLALPIARRSGRVVGVDVSAPMLREAERNAAAQGITNASFVEMPGLPEALGGVSPDFIHSCIVFQHIPPLEGMRLAADLVERLAPGGLGALHFVHEARSSWPKRLVNRMRHVLRPVNAAVNALKGRPLAEPSIPMFAYPETAVMELLHRNRCTPVRRIPTDHGGFLGAMHLFTKA